MYRLTYKHSCREVVRGHIQNQEPKYQQGAASTQLHVFVSGFLSPQPVGCVLGLRVRRRKGTLVSDSHSYGLGTRNEKGNCFFSHS